MAKTRNITKITKTQNHPREPGIYPIKSTEGWTVGRFDGGKWSLFGDASLYDANDIPVFEFRNRIILPSD